MHAWFEDSTLSLVRNNCDCSDFVYLFTYEINQANQDENIGIFPTLSRTNSDLDFQIGFFSRFGEGDVLHIGLLECWCGSGMKLRHTRQNFYTIDRPLLEQQNSAIYAHNWPPVWTGPYPSLIGPHLTATLSSPHSHWPQISTPSSSFLDASTCYLTEKIQKHNRFLLTGVKLSATTALYSSLDSTLTNVSETVPLIKCKKTLTDEPVPVISKPTSTIPSTTSEPVKPVIADRGGGSVQLMNAGGNNGSSSTSSISEYLMEILPGYHVDDFLDSPCGFFKSGDSDALPLWDSDLANNLSFISQESIGFWVPQSPPLYPPLEMVYATPNGFKDSKEISSNKSSRKWSDDNMYAVPQISPPSTAFKRSKTSW
ncbi:B-box zinc finger protein 21-like [Olea europaea var. sylvestris]|uniref:B-box zinc finger protein 21-like n=1 Tax=Olea europaea var. sylvestris TaxID=158386 RepID=UPI000C1D458C|nr:B-box zinc finger protein 21-like [Olea europaea var. sylvestris]